MREAVQHTPDIIMLDNFSIADAKKAIKIINKKSKIELSGNMDRKKIARYGKLDVDYISAGAITHSVKAYDFSLLVTIRNEVEVKYE